MGNKKGNMVSKADGQQTSSFVGTAISVSVVGAVILVTYIVLYGLYMARV